MCVSLQYTQGSALNKALSCVALEAPYRDERLAGRQTCCLASVPLQGLTIVLPFTPFVLFRLQPPPLTSRPRTPPPSFLVSCLAGAADPGPEKKEVRPYQTIATPWLLFMLNFFVLSLNLIIYFRDFNISFYIFVNRLNYKNPLCQDTDMLLMGFPVSLGLKFIV